MKKITFILMGIGMVLAAGIGVLMMNRQGVIHFDRDEISSLSSMKVKKVVSSSEQKIKEKTAKESPFLEGVDLIGTLILKNNPIAVIREAGLSEAGFFKIGDKINGAQIIEIDLGKVVFLKDGIKKVLFVSSVIDYDVPFQVLTASDIAVNRKVLAMKVTSVNQFIDGIDFVPYIEKGKIIGFKLTNVENNSLIKKAGLRGEDIIRSVNGKELNNIQDAVDVIKILRSQENIFQVKVEIDRKNSAFGDVKKQVLNYLMF